MRKLFTKLLVFLLAVTSVFGLTGLKSVKAEEVTINGFEIIGASLRTSADDDASDLTGIRFEVSVSQEAYEEIIAKAGNKEVIFGVKVTDVDDLSPQYISNV